MNSCPEDDCLPIGRTDKCLASPSACTSVWHRSIGAYTTAAIFNVSSLNASAVTSVIFYYVSLSLPATHSLSCTQSHLATYHYTHYCGKPKSSRHTINWLESQPGRGLNGLSWDIITLSKNKTAAANRTCFLVFTTSTVSECRCLMASPCIYIQKETEEEICQSCKAEV